MAQHNQHLAEVGDEYRKQVKGRLERTEQMQALGKKSGSKTQNRALLHMKSPAAPSPLKLLA
jgi:hypothetical protein